MSVQNLLAFIALAAWLPALAGCGEATSPPSGSQGVVAQAAVHVTSSSEPALIRTVPERVRDATFDDIKLDLAKDEPFVDEKLTESVRQLVGQRIRIRGYIHPSAFTQKLASFVLTRDNQECCFGDGAALHDCIFIEMQNGTTADFTTYPVMVQGRVRVRVQRDFDGKQNAIYQIDGESVQ
jgi:hypothetical protein